MSLDQELLAQIDKYKEIMQKDPNSREFLTLADLYRKLGVAEEATHILQDGLKKHPDFVDARLAIARIYLTQGQVEDATREFEQVIQQDASNFVAYKLLGEIAMQKQEHEKAAERFGAAYHLKPDDQECKVMLDYIGSLLGKDVTPQLEGAPPPQAAAPSPAPTAGETIAVTPEGEFGEFEEFEEAEELEEVGELEEEVAVFGGAEEFEEIEEFGEQEDIEEVEIEESDFSEEEFIEEEIIEEEFAEEVDETGEFEVEEMEEVEPFDVEEMTGIEEFEEEEVETAEEEQAELLEEPVEREEELVSQIFQELSDSKYTSDEGGLLDSGEGELEDLMGLLEAKEPEEIVGELDLEEPEEEEVLEEEKDLESMIDLEGIPGMEELQEEGPAIEDIGVVEEEMVVQEIEEFEEIEEIEEFPEEVEEIEEFEEGSAGIEEFEEIEEIEEEPEGGEAEVPEIAEQEVSSEESSIFQDFGLAGGEELEVEELEVEELETEELETEELETGELEAEEEGDVFQDFDFDVFEQELLKDHPPEEIEETFEEPIAQEVETAEIAESMEALEELPEDMELEEFEEVPIEEEFEVEEEAGEEGELPTVSLAELYIKQDLFDEATSIYREILRSDPSDNMIRQMLEETVALQAYIEGGE